MLASTHATTHTMLALVSPIKQALPRTIATILNTPPNLTSLFLQSQVPGAIFAANIANPDKAAQANIIEKTRNFKGEHKLNEKFKMNDNGKHV